MNSKGRSAALSGKSSKPISARDAALLVLTDVQASRRTTREAIDALLGEGRIGHKGLSMTMELVMGVLRHRMTLTSVLEPISGKGLKHVSPPLKHILMLAAYQIIWLDGIPDFAAVNEAVEQAKSAGSRRAGRFVNAILRNLLRTIEHRRISSDRADPIRAIPIDAQQCCQLTESIFPDPAEKPAEHLAHRTSHPDWLVSRWISRFGVQKSIEICMAGIFRPPVFLRPNPIRTDLAALADSLKNEGFDPEVTQEGDALAIVRAARYSKTPAFVKGLFQPQDPSAAKPVKAMSLKPGKVVLDLCAGLGTKTTQMAEIMGDEGVIIACDKEQTKLPMLEANCKRLGIASVRTVLSADLEKTLTELPALDWILVDVPCTNSGVLARRPEARYRINRKTLLSLSKIQRSIIERAAAWARPDTRLMYSTCSLEHEENTDIVAGLIKSSPQWRIIDSELTLPAAGKSPTQWHDGGYWAILAQQ
ncbi:MAG: transcription antitermination factor NusB [Planctomycetota bacterium]